MHSSMNHTDVQVGCLEVLGDYHKFKLVCKHLFPYFTENCNFSILAPLWTKEEEFFTKMAPSVDFSRMQVRGM